MIYWEQKPPQKKVNKQPNATLEAMEETTPEQHFQLFPSAPAAEEKDNSASPSNGPAYLGWISPWPFKIRSWAKVDPMFEQQGINSFPILSSPFTSFPQIRRRLATVNSEMEYTLTHENSGRHPGQWAAMNGYGGETIHIKRTLIHLGIGRAPPIYLPI